MAATLHFLSLAKGSNRSCVSSSVAPIKCVDFYFPRQVRFISLHSPQESGSALMKATTKEGHWSLVALVAAKNIVPCSHLLWGHPSCCHCHWMRINVDNRRCPLLQGPALLLSSVLEERPTRRAPSPTGGLIPLLPSM